MTTLIDKQFQFFGSDRVYYSGLAVGSTTKWTFVDFSGTDTGFGTAGNERCHKLTVVSSGTSFVQWSYVSGPNAVQLAGEVWNGNAISMDGVNVSGIWVRSDTAAQSAQVWAW